MSALFTHCGIKYSSDQADWLNSWFAPSTSETGERRETEAEDRLLGLQETVRLAAEQRRRYIRLPDPFGDTLLLFIFAAAVLLGLLVIAGFG